MIRELMMMTTTTMPLSIMPLLTFMVISSNFTGHHITGRLNFINTGYYVEDCMAELLQRIKTPNQVSRRE